MTIPKETASGTGTFTLTPMQDSIAEGDETIDVTGSATDFTVTKAEVTLTDDETAPASITLTVSPTSVSEDDGATPVTVTATLGGSATLPDATEVTVSVGGGSATLGTDYTAVSDFTVTIPKESASGTGRFTLTPTNDSLAEGDETIDVTGMATDFTVTQAQVTLTDDVPPVEVSYSQASYTVAEGSSLTVTVELSAVPEREVEVALTHTAQGNTTAADYSGVPTSVTFASDETSKTFSFAAAPDEVDDDGDSVVLGFGSSLPASVTVGSPATATVNITDNDDPAVTVSFGASSYTVAEGSSLTVTVELSGAPEREVEVALTHTAQGNTTAADYSGVPTSVTFASDETSKTFTFTAAADDADDDGDSVVLGFETPLPDGVSAGATATSTVSITDDDVPSVQVSFGAASYTVAEGLSVTVTVELSAAPERSVSVPLTHTAQGDTSSGDYSLSATSVTFAADETSATFTVSAASDSVDDDGESVVLGFGTTLPTGFSEGSPDEATVNITDDDDPPVLVSFGASSYSVVEGEGVDVSVVLSAAPGSEVEVPLTHTLQGGATGLDFSAVQGLTFGSGETSKTFAFIAVPDGQADRGESVLLGFDALPPGFAAGSPDTAAVSITDAADAPSVQVSYGASSYSVAEGSSVTVTVVLSEDPGREVEVPLTHTAQGETTAADYSGVPESVTFASGDTSETFTLAAASDSVDDDGESVLLGFGSELPTGFTAGDPATVNITDDPADVPSVSVSFGESSYTVAEGAAVTVTVELDIAPEREVEVALTHTVQGDTTAADYSGVPTRVTFGSSETEQTFTFTAADDDVDDDGDSVLLGFGELPDGVSEGATATSTVSITDDDVPRVQVFFEPDAYTVAEDSAVTVTVRLDVAPERLVSVPITVANQGDTTAADYSLSATSVVFAGDETEQSFRFGADDDTVDDDGESVVLGFGELPARVSAPDTTARPATATVSITDDDTASASITLTTLPATVSESASETTVTVTATLDGSVTLSTATEVTVSVGGGTATSGTDYGEVSNFTVTIPKETASGTGTFTLTPMQDSIAEGDETIDVTGSATDFTVTKAEVTLTDDETAPASITLTVSPTSVSEDDGATPVTVTATLGGSATLPDATEVTVSVGGGSATLGTDYTAVSDFTVTIPKESASGTGRFTLTPTNDSLAEGDETIDVTGTATDFTVTQAQVTLTDDVPPVEVSYSQASYTVAEGSSLTVTVELSAVPEREVEVALTHIAQGNTTAADYSGVPTRVTFAADETEQTFTFTAAADDVDDDGDSVLLGFGTPLPDGVSAGATATSTVSITDDDVPPVQVFFEPDAYTVAEDSAVTVTVRLDVAPERLVSVPITVANQGDTTAADYSLSATRVVFAGDETEQSFRFGADDDTVDDDGESVVLGFGVLPARVSAPDTTARPASATVSITDDDTASASITLTTLPATVSESASETTVTVTATLGGSVTLGSATQVTVSVGGGTATSGTDYTAVSNFTVTIPKETASGTGTFILTPNNDSLAEGDETIDVTGTVDGFTVTKGEMTLTDDDTAQRTVSFDKQVFTVTEGATRQVLMQVDLSGPLDREVTIPLTTTHGSGVEANDYVLAAIGVEDYYAGNDAWTSLDGDLVFPSAETAKIIQVTAVDDGIVEDDEILELGFGTLPEGISPGSIRVARVTITDNDSDDDGDDDNDDDGDAPPTTRATLHLSDADGEVAEDAGAVTVTATVSPASASGFTVTVSASPVAPATDADFELSTNRVLRFAANANASIGTVTIAPVDDGDAEPTRVVTVAGSASVAGVTGPDDVTLTILDDDAPRIRGICDRTPRVRDRILVRLKVEHGFEDTCAEVTEADLAKLTLLDLRRNPSNEPAFTLSLQRHDFEGLSNLVELDLADTGLATLPAGVFDGLANLETLNLNKNRLGSLPPWVFVDLRSLETLRLQKNPSLRSLPYDELEELPALTLLRVDREGRRKLQVAGGEGDAALEVAAGASATYRVRLMAAPDFRITAANPVRIGVNSDTVGVTASPTTLPFTRGDWFRRQTVTVRAEAAASAATATLAHEPSGTTTDSQGQPQSNYDFESYPLPKVTVRVTGDAGAAAHGRSATVRGPAAVAAADARAREGEDATIDFAVTLSRAVPATVEVSYATADGTATAGEDYMHTGGKLGFAPGETVKTVRVPVLDDVVDEGEETFTLRLAKVSGAVIGDRVATGTIINSDPLQGMLLSGFGRTVAGQVLDAVTGRLSEAPTGSRVTLGGRSIDPSADTGAVRHPSAATPGAAGATTEGGPPAGPAARGGGTGTTGRGLPLGGSFHVATGDGEAGGPSVVVWGRTTVSDFHAEARADNGAVRLDGEVAAGILGADTEMGRWLAGVAVAASRGEGTFVQPGGDSGTVDSRLISVNPYVRYAASDRLMAWGMLGYGIGDITIRGNSVVHTDVSLRLGAAGARGVLLAGGGNGGIDLALRGDAFLVRMRAAAAANSMETRVEASRLRLGLEAGRSFALGDGVLAPALELGLRHDGGDARTATGIELGARIRYVDRGSGLTVEANARTMVAHHDSSYREWGAGGSVRLDAAGRGLSFSLAPVWGTPSSAVDRLWSARDAADLVRAGTFEAERRLLGEIGYGFGAFRGRGLVTPFVGLGLGRAEDRTWRAGARWSLAPHLAMGLDLLTRRKPSNDDDAQHGGRFRLALHW